MIVPSLVLEAPLMIVPSLVLKAPVMIVPSLVLTPHDCTPASPLKRPS